MLFLDPEVCHRAVATRDPRFDGVFYLGVRTTGIYCRTICRARRPLPVNCRFFPHPASAELAGFRPCLLCRPERAPGYAPVDAAASLARAAVRAIESGALGDGENLGALSARLGISARHLRRVTTETLGVSPIQLAQTWRLLMARRLLRETDLPIGEIALSSGFRSLRRCNALFRARYQKTPGEFRRQSGSAATSLPRAGMNPDGGIQLRVGYRPPYAWEELIRYCMGRAIPGVESISPGRYARTLQSGRHTGWLAVEPEPGSSHLRITVSAGLTPALPEVLATVRQAFDLDASPQEVNSVLGADPLLAPSVEAAPGLRLPGAMDPFETAVRTIIGQQVSVAAATTVMGRIVKAFATPFATPFPELNRLTLTPGRLAAQTVDTLAPLGLNAARASALCGLARAVDSGNITLGPTADPSLVMTRLQTLPGIGPWTAHYFGMRILGWPDAFIAGDLVVRRSLAPLTLRQVEERSSRWSPWRAYAVMHLWRSAGFFQTAKPTLTTASTVNSAVPPSLATDA